MVTADTYGLDVLGLDVAVVAYGRPAMDALAERVIAAKNGNPLAPVTVVVPSNYASVACRRYLAGRPGGIANVAFLTLHRLAERLGGPALAAANRRPVSAPVTASAVRAVLRHGPGIFEPVADHPATEQALVAAHRELRVVPDDELDALADTSPRAHDVVRVHRAVQARLESSWFDEQDLLVAATNALDPVAAAELGPTIIHLLPELTLAAGDFLLALAGHQNVTVHVALTGDDGADNAVIDSYARAGILVAGNPTIDVAHADHIISTSDPDDEVRAAIRRIVQWMGEDVSLGRVAVLYAAPDPYARLLNEQLTAAGIPLNGTPVRAIGDLLVGRTVRAMLALPDRLYRRGDVLSVLTGAPLLDGDKRVPGRRWERLSRDAGVVADGDWDHRLATHAAALRAKAERADADEREWLGDRYRRDADASDALALFVKRLRADIDTGMTLTTWTELVAWAKHLVTTYLGDDRHRASWPEDEVAAAHRVEEALDRLAGLDTIDGPTPTLDVFRRALDSELDTALRRIGRFGDGVLVGHLSMAGGLVLDRVIVLGLAEGSFPPKRLEDSLLHDDERAVTTTLPLRASRVHDDRRQLLAAIAAAEEAVLCQPRGDLRRAGERPASRWLLADANVLAKTTGMRSDELHHHAHEPWLDLVASYAAGLATTPALTTEQELRLAAIARGTTNHASLDDQRLVAALDVVRARRSPDFTRFDGNLGAVADEITAVTSASASRLQTWASCPHQYFLRYVLKVEPVDEPERRLEIDALDTGNLIHGILDEFVSFAIDSGHSLDKWTDADRVRLHEIAERHFATYEAEGRTGRDLLWRRDRARILADLDKFLDQDSERLAQGFHPLATERHFDLQLTLPSGHVLEVSGAADRIDRRPDGGLAVLDYKSGRSEYYAGLSEDNPHDRGTRLQLYLYAMAAAEAFPTDDPVYSAYWFPTDKGRFKQVGYPVTDAVQASVGAAIDTIVDGIAAGVFPLHPPVPSGWSGGWTECPYCAPDGLSTADRRRDWERKRHATALAGYLALAEPEEVLDADD